MENLAKKESELLIKLSTEELNSKQVRLIKMMNSLMNQILTAEDEAEYFELSVSLLKKSAEIIKASHFTNNQRTPVAKQALEFALDFYHDSLIEEEPSHSDN